MVSGAVPTAEIPPDVLLDCMRSLRPPRESGGGMTWIYRPIPETLRLPACERCSNRLRVTMVLRCVFLCSDCNHVFSAVWVAESATALREEQAG